MKDTLYISDLDGTLLNDDNTISDYSINNLNWMIKNNLKFTVASARPYKMIRHILSDLELDLPIIELNGALITDFNTGTPLVVNHIYSEILIELQNIIQKLNCFPLFFSLSENDIFIFYDDSLNEGMKIKLDELRIFYNNSHIIRLNTIDYLLYETLNIIVIDVKDKILQLHNKITVDLSNEISAFIFIVDNYKRWYCLSINSLAATKANGILNISKMFDLDLYQITVFGDNLNDVGMFKVADRSVATSNAEKNLKSIANYIIGENNNDSVVNYILHDQSYI